MVASNNMITAQLWHQTYWLWHDTGIKPPDYMSDCGIKSLDYRMAVAETIWQHDCGIKPLYYCRSVSSNHLTTACKTVASNHLIKYCMSDGGIKPLNYCMAVAPNHLIIVWLCYQTTWLLYGCGIKPLDYCMAVASNHLITVWLWHQTAWLLLNYLGNKLTELISAGLRGGWLSNTVTWLLHNCGLNSHRVHLTA